MAHLGHMYANGEGVEQSNSTAAAWFGKAAEHGGRGGAGRGGAGCLAGLPGWLAGGCRVAGDVPGRPRTPGLPLSHLSTNRTCPLLPVQATPRATWPWATCT